MSEFTSNDRITIWGNIKNIFKDKELIENKLQELFSYENFTSYLRKLDDIYYELSSEEELNNPEIENVILLLLDGLISQEYFYKNITDEKHYDYTKIRKKFDDIKKYLVSSSNITLNTPIHPNYTYNDIFHTLTSEYNLSDDFVHNLLKKVFDKKKKPPQTLQAKREIKSIVDILHNIVTTAEKSGNHSKEDIERSYKEITELKKHFK